MQPEILSANSANIPRSDGRGEDSDNNNANNLISNVDGVARYYLLSEDDFQRSNRNWKWHVGTGFVSASLGVGLLFASTTNCECRLLRPGVFLIIFGLFKLGRGLELGRALSSMEIAILKANSSTC